MNIAIAQLNYVIGHFEHNTAKIIAAIEAAKQQGADLVIFAELAICGYPPRDFLAFDEFVQQCHQSALTIAQHCKGIACIIGLPVENPQAKGKDLYNAAYFIAEGAIQSCTKKALLPNYDVFDEYRYFEPNTEFSVVEYKGKRIALTICEDLWNIEEEPLYTLSPMDELMKQHPDMMINIAASPFAYQHAEARKKVLSANAKKYQLPLLYVNQVGAQTELIFDGGSLAFNANGEVVDELAYFEEELRVVKVGSLKSGVGSQGLSAKSQIASIHEALILGIRDYFQKSGFSKAILGLSGGIDSAVVLALAVAALGKDNVLSVLMPSEFSSDHSVSDSEEMVKRLGSKQENIAIKELYDSYAQTLKPQFEGLPFNLAEENLQARIRGTVLMAMSNKFGYILLNTSNKSENAVGYGTLYGDMCGGLSVLGDVYKMQVYELARYINTLTNSIPQNIIDKAPSAELRPNQKDADSLPDYALLDAILHQYIEEHKSTGNIIASGFDEAVVKRVVKLVNTNEYKRFQAPPILRISNKAFGMGRRMPIVGKY